MQFSSGHNFMSAFFEGKKNFACHASSILAFSNLDNEVWMTSSTNFLARIFLDSNSVRKYFQTFFKFALIGRLEGELLSFASPAKYVGLVITHIA